MLNLGDTNFIKLVSVLDENSFPKISLKLHKMLTNANCCD